MNLKLVRIRHLAGRGVPVADIAALTDVLVEDLMLGGKYHREMRIGKAEGVAKIAEALYLKALGGKTIEGLFWMKCNAGWSETAAGRQKNKQADEEDDAIGGIEVEVIE